MKRLFAIFGRVIFLITIVGYVGSTRSLLKHLNTYILHHSQNFNWSLIPYLHTYPNERKSGEPLQRLFVSSNTLINKTDRIFDHFKFKIAGVFPFFKPHSDTIELQDGVQIYLAYKYMIDLINRVHNGSYGAQFVNHGTINYFPGDSITNTAKKVVELEQVHEVFASIGSSNNAFTYYHMLVNGASSGRLFSYAASSTYFDHEVSCKHDTLKSPPSNYYRLQVLLKIFEYHNWQLVNFVVSAGINGEADFSQFWQLMVESKICERTVITIENAKSVTSHQFRVDELKKMKLLVLFTTETDSHMILGYLRKYKIKLKLVFVYGITTNIDFQEQNKDVLDGAISIDLNLPEDLPFKDFVLNSTLKSLDDDKYVVMALEKIHKCRIDRIKFEHSHRKFYKKLCNENELKFTEGNGYYRNAPVKLVIWNMIGLYHFFVEFVMYQCAYLTYSSNGKACDMRDFRDGNSNAKVATSHLWPKFCKNPANFFLNGYPYNYDNETLFKENPLDNIISYNIYHFTKTNGTYSNDVIGEWTLKFDRSSKTIVDRYLQGKLRFHIDEKYAEKYRLLDDVINEKCTRTCNGRFVTRAIPGERCCVKCVACTEREVVLNNNCERCPYGEIANNLTNQCKLLPFKYMTDYPRWVLIVLAISFIGLILVVFVIIEFIYYNNSKVIRASGREMCHSVFGGCAVLLLYPLLFYWEPSNSACFLRDVLPFLTHLGCSVAIMLKTIRIYRIFIHRKHRISPPMTSPKSLGLLLFMLMPASLCFYGISYLSTEEYGPYIHESKDQLFITKHCRLFDDDFTKTIFLILGFSAVFTIINIIVSALTRHCPKNFNEARRICGYSLLCLVSMLFCAYLIFTLKNEELFYTEFITIFFYQLFAYLTILLLFIPKVRSAMREKKYGRQDSVSSGSMTRQRAGSSMTNKRLESVSSTEG